VNKANWQKSAGRFTGFFNKLAKARLSSPVGTPLAPALAEAVGSELSAINATNDLPPGVAMLWTEFLDKHVGMNRPDFAPTDPLARLRAMTDAQAEDAMAFIGDMQGTLTEALKKAR
jgi:hypothetical protein